MPRPPAEKRLAVPLKAQVGLLAEKSEQKVPPTAKGQRVQRPGGWRCAESHEAALGGGAVQRGCFLGFPIRGQWGTWGREVLGEGPHMGGGLWVELLRTQEKGAPGAACLAVTPERPGCQVTRVQSPGLLMCWRGRPVLSHWLLSWPPWPSDVGTLTRPCPASPSPCSGDS